MVAETFSENVFGGNVATGIRELARQSGVSVATVSRVLNGYRDVSDETRRKVLALAEELDYTPSAAARTLVTQRSHVIGVILDTGPEHPDLQHPFFQEVLVGLTHRIGAAGFDLLLFATELPGNGYGPHSYLKRARHHRVDGVVLFGVDPVDPEVARLLESGIPCVAIDADVRGEHAGRVGSDNVAGARLAVRHLHALGHERIATIAGPQATVPGADRLRGYREAFAELGLHADEALVQEGDFYPESGADAMTALLALPEPPTAVFAASDLMAIGALRAAQGLGRRVPEDVAIVGFDDVELAAQLRPALTTVRQDKLGLGAAAAEGLIRMIEDESAEAPVVTLPVELAVRESCGARAAEDEEVAGHPRSR
jgi:LacI family transcriptional regulator